jgi:hypothetical protein
MKKVWTYKRKAIKGWYESGTRNAKVLSSKQLAEYYERIRCNQLNSDVFTSIVAADRQQMVAEYREARKVQGVTERTLYEIALSLRNCERLVGKCNSQQITQSIVDKFTLQRDCEVKLPTLNKDIRNLKTVINWCRGNRYLNGTIKIRELKEEERPEKSLNHIQMRELLAAAQPHQKTRMRI